MTRKQIESQWDVNSHGVITDLGKFGGEMLYAPYFYDAVMNGCGERIGDADFFEINAEDVKEFPELHDGFGVTLCESDQGFVYVRVHGKAEFELLKREAEQWDAEHVED